MNVNAGELTLQSEGEHRHANITSVATATADGKSPSELVAEDIDRER